MKLVVAGGSGLIGSALIKDALSKKHEVIQLVRRKPKHQHEVQWNPDKFEVEIDALNDATAIINLSGAGVGDKRWTKNYKKLILTSRVNATTTLAEAITRLNNPPSVFVSSSAIGFYGDTAENAVDENAELGEGFLSDVVFNWEYAAQKVKQHKIRVVHPRTSLVMSKRGGVLKKVLPIFKLGLGGKLGNGKQFWSWITLHDELRAIEFILENEKISGAINLTSPNPVTNQEFTSALARALRRPALFPAPAIALKLALGGFSTEILGSKKVIPGVLQEAGFQFDYPHIGPALEALTD